MRRSLNLILLLVAALLAAPGLAHAAEVPAGAKWSEATIPSTDGVQLHADILRPAHLPENAKTPVILSIGPYFNHSGQTGAVGPAQNAEYDPTGEAGPSDRFTDLIDGAKLMKEGYTVVYVDLRGFGGSNGCLDWGGPGEQADVVAAIKWSAAQKWSTGKVGMYGKSYDGVTGLVGVNKRPAGLEAVVSQEPVYDLYRYLYGDGIRRANAGLTPTLYNAIAATPGTLRDNPLYNASSLNDPACLSKNFAEQAGDDNHDSDYWKARNLIPGAKGSDVPLLLTQGLTENNTVADGMAEYLENHTGYERAWLGPWEHVRGGERNAQGRLLMGREGWYDEVLRFYDRFLKGEKPEVQDPMVAVQTNDGKWRGEDVWPPADSSLLTTKLRTGEYQDNGDSTATGSGANATSGIWTVSKPLTHDVHFAGSGRATVEVEVQAPRANLVVDVYDLDKNGKGPLITRQGHLLRDSGTFKLDLWSADWKIAAGRRVGVRITETNQDWWLMTAGTQQTVTVKNATVSLPFLRYKRDETIQGKPGTQLPGYLAKVVTLPKALLDESTSATFAVPPALVARPASRKSDGGGGSGAGSQQGSQGGPGAGSTRPAIGRAARKLTARLRALRKGRLRVTGRAPKGSKLVVKLRRGKRTVATRRVTVKRGTTYRVTFRVRRAGRYTAVVTGTAAKKRLSKATARPVRARLR